MSEIRSVLHVAFPAHGGVARVVSDLARAQLQQGMTVTVASPDGPLARWLNGGVTQLRWDARRSPGPSVLGETLRLRDLIRRVGPDLVHLHSSKAGLAGRLALRGQLPTVFQPHAWSFLAATGSLAQAAIRWERLATRWTDVIVHVSEAERRRGEQAGIHSRDWALAVNGVDLTTFRPRDREEARRRLGLDDGPLAVCAGRISRQKAQDLLVDVWPKVAAAVPNAQLALVGRVEQPLRSLPPGVRVWPERDDPVDWYAAADVVVVPSRWEAGLPLVAREAMACGRCVLISNLDVMTDDFPPGVGAVVPVDDANAWTDVIASRLADRDTTDREGRAGGEHAASRFGLATAADRMHDIYLQAQSARRQ